MRSTSHLFLHVVVKWTIFAVTTCQLFSPQLLKILTTPVSHLDCWHSVELETLWHFPFNQKRFACCQRVEEFITQGRRKWEGLHWLNLVWLLSWVRALNTGKESRKMIHLRISIGKEFVMSWTIQCGIILGHLKWKSWWKETLKTI